MFCKLTDALLNNIRKSEAVLTGDPNSGQQEVDIMEIKAPGWTVHVHMSISMFGIDSDISVQHR